MLLIAKTKTYYRILKGEILAAAPGQVFTIVRSISVGPLKLSLVKIEKATYPHMQIICEMIESSSVSNQNIAQVKAFLYLYSYAYSLTNLCFMREMLSIKEKEQLEYFRAMFDKIVKMP